MKTPTKKPGSALDAIYRRTDLTPKQVFETLGRLRREAERQIEYLIELVNEIDGDTDAEPEPIESNYSGFDCLRSDLDEAEGDAVDDEPSLGWPEGHMAHGQGMLGGFDDRELATETVITVRRRLPEHRAA